MVNLIEIRFYEGPNVYSSQRSPIEPGRLRKSASKIPGNSPIEPGIPGVQ
jgi:hypothetical protein